MKTFQLVVLTICVIGALARPEGEDDSPPPSGGDHAKWHEKHKKHIECAHETKNLTACCPSTKHEEFKNDPECKSHLEGIEDKDDKQKGKAAICFMDCLFKSKGLIEGKDVKWDKIKEFTAEHTEPEFKEVTEKAVEFCEAKGKEAQEKFKNHKGGPHKHHHKEGEKRCGMLAAMVAGCIQGYVVRSCPESKWTGTDECNALKSSAKTIEECTSH